jgi:predicted XRE-type DNA-binding protein
VSSQFSITELIYPVKIDSLYIHAGQLKYEKELSEKKAKPGKIFLYHPSQLGLTCKDLIVKTQDSLLLKNWFVMDSSIKSTTTVIVLPDIKESKFHYIDKASGFIDRGLNVCLVDLRAQGESEGSKYTMGKITVQDVSAVIDSVISKFKSENIVLMGTGTGAAIACQAIENEKRVNVLVLQNPFLNLNDYLEKYAEVKYGRFSKFFFGRMKKNLEEEMSFSADSLNLSELLKHIDLPSLFISKIFENYLDYKSTQQLFDSAAASKKEWMVFKDTENTEQNLEEKKKYYDKIAAFINSNLPKKKKQSKFKKLVYN